MKLLSKILLITYLILIINPVFAIEKSSINLENNPVIENTHKNIRQAKSIENEVTRFRNKLILVQKKYKLEKDPKINRSLKDLWEIIYILRKVQTTKINKPTADKVIKIVINDLRNINIVTKKHFKKIKYNLKKNKNSYIKISEKLASKLNKITNAFIKHYKNKENITKRDKEIIKIVIEIYNNTKKIKEFKDKVFYNKEDMREYLLKYFNNIKQNFSEIRKILKK